jgi:hypothetical protein
LPERLGGKRRDLRLRWSIGPTQSSPACNHSIAVFELYTAAIQVAARRHPASLAFAALPIQAVDVGKIHG